MVDAEGMVAAAFRQHTSRAVDPQLHTHLVVAEPGAAPRMGGGWRWTPAPLKVDQRTLSALYHAGLRAELTAPARRPLGRSPCTGSPRWPTSPRVAGGVLPADRDVDRRVDEKLDRFADDDGPGADGAGTVAARTRSRRWTAAPPSPSPSPAASCTRGGPTRSRRSASTRPSVVDGAVGWPVARQVDRSVDATTGSVDQAMAALVERQSTWRPAELVRELAAAVPTDHRPRPPTSWSPGWIRLAGEVAVARCVDLSRPVPPGALLRRDGRPVTESALDRALTTQAILDQEADLLAWADRRLTHPGTPNRPPPTAPTIELTGGTGRGRRRGGRHATIWCWSSGPAGTGKTTALAPAVEQLRADGRVGVRGRPLGDRRRGPRRRDRRGGRHARQAPRRTPLHRPTRPPLRPARRRHRHRRRGRDGPHRPARRTGRPRRRAGLAGGAGRRPVAVLRRRPRRHVRPPRRHPRRDRARPRPPLHPRLGTRRQPAAAPRRPRRPRRLRRSTAASTAAPSTAMERAAVDAWWDHRQAGENVAPDGADQRDRGPAQPARPATPPRRRRARPRPAARLRWRAVRLHVGDEIATRRNDRHLVTDRGEMVRNRARLDHHRHPPRPRLTVTGRHGTVTLPARYVAEHVELGYATTATPPRAAPSTTPSSSSTGPAMCGTCTSR